MKHLSIKMKLTLWYAALMLVLAALVLGFTVLIGQNVSRNSAQDSLTQIVNANLAEVEYDDGEVSVDDDFAYFSQGVTSLVYMDRSGNTELVSGTAPSGFTSTLALQDNSVQTVQSSGQTYYVFDRVTRLEQRGMGHMHYIDVWVRGIASESGSGGTTYDTLFVAILILLPMIVLVAILLGYWMSKRAFKPIEQITGAANAISEGQDLSKRIGLAPGSDEISQLATTFDNMFARLEASFEAQRRFNSDVSHELRTPMSVIVSQCEYSLENAANEEEYKEALETIQRQAARMSQMIDQLLTFTRLERGLEEPRFENLDLSALTLLICEDFAQLLPAGRQLRTQIEPQIMATVDRTLYNRLLSNLLGNAIKYGREGGWAEVKLEAAADRLVLSVTDNGIGIAADDLTRIWEHFYQVDPSRTAGADNGCGLGLAMVKQIAKLHGADISVSSTPGQGSLFSVSFPH